jgi:hypothetical protein
VTHTSTDPSAADGRFRRGVAVTIAVLIVACAVVAGLNYLQGPKLNSATIDTDQVVSLSGQQLRLFANQPIAEVTADQVRVRPETPFTVSDDGQTTAVTFTGRLRYDTEYRVTVQGVEAASGGRPASFSHSFHTPRAGVMYLDRADPTIAGEGEDRILLAGLSGSGATEVYSARRIQAFARFDRVLAVVTIEDDDSSTLSFVSADGATVERVVLPGTGAITQLSASPKTGLLGFVFTSAGPTPEREFDHTLMTVDFAGKHVVTPAAGLDGSPLSVLSWTFLGDSTSVAALSGDQSVLLFDAAEPGVVTPLGDYLELGSSSPDGAAVVLADYLSYLRYSIEDGAEERLTPPDIGGEPSFGGDIRLLSDGGRVQQVAVYDANSVRYISYLVVVEPDSTRILYGGAESSDSFDGFSLSPNDQYVALTVVPDYGSSVSDSYPADPRATSVTTLVIDVATGKMVRAVAGFDLSW